MSENVDTEKVPESNYHKDKAYLVTDYAEAATLADQLFAPYGEKDSTGSRTTAEVKVRIKSCTAGGFRVVFSKRVSARRPVVPNPKKKQENRESYPQRRRRHDRKGRQRECMPKNGQASLLHRAGDPASRGEAPKQTSSGGSTTDS